MPIKKKAFYLNLSISIFSACHPKNKFFWVLQIKALEENSVFIPSF